MDDSKEVTLSKYRFEQSERCIRSAKLLLSDDDYRGAANRSYYAIYNAIRSIFALDGIEFKRHSGNISHFRKEYIQTGVFDKSLSQIVGDAFEIRSNSDYDDYTIIDKEDVKEQVENAEKFCDIIKEYLLKRYNNEY
ncbi:MAG: HEPN domain-containing protein [Lachnospiraceae bacterium]|nr:HEPN domain-containing protein [Lachnospiraceae bacterium]